MSASVARRSRLPRAGCCCDWGEGGLIATCRIREKTLWTRPAIRSIRPFVPVTGQVGRVAQLVEQLTLNQRVHGSSPCAPTKIS